MAASFLLLLLLHTSSLFSFSSSLSRETVLDAADILSDSGYTSMSLTLQALYQTLLSQTPSLTIFAPSDSSFTKSGQPSLDLLRFHLSPLPLPPQNLRLLPAGSEIPTLLNNHTLIVTESHSDFEISLNYVRVIGSSPIYEDGLFLIYGIDSFFDPDFRYTPASQEPSPNPICGLQRQTMSSSDSFSQAIETLRSTGYYVTASFLGLQMNGISNEAAMTVFAPEDEMAKNLLANFSEYPSFFLRHVVPCKLLWNDLADLNSGSNLPTMLEGFSINVARSGGVLALNGVSVVFPNIFHSDKLVVHGVSDALVAH
ncbi:putative fasciclin-like arabinogalactan protein 20 [Neltuma alba]|uniref:putative fasciclin-like arabinogalactan protein 20 n=1 Tax=Neltuma alba TaxID=207710 RepID=UPI0010A4CFA1|nr:putative fasciclin-like arabinogalactan protein 20 [Prosopis alba]